MANGFWGGRLPVLNIVVSKAVFVVMGWRSLWLRAKNHIRKIIKPQHEIKFNTEIARAGLKCLIEDGYTKLNVGGGPKNLVGFINIDFISHPNVTREVVANILDLSFVPTGCASQIHTNHVIEHLSENQLLEQLKEYQRILKNNGVLTIRCPNALGVAYGFWFEPILENDKQGFINCGFPEDEHFENPDDRWGHKDIYAFFHWIYGDVGNIANQHMNIITPTKIKSYMKTAGFEIVKMNDPEALNIVIVATKI